MIKRFYCIEKYKNILRLCLNTPNNLFEWQTNTLMMFQKKIDFNNLSDVNIYFLDDCYRNIVNGVHYE